MKKFLGTSVLALIQFFAIAQNPATRVSGSVTEARGAAIPGAVISFGNRQAVSDEKGRFSLEHISQGSYELTVSSLGFSTYRQQVTVKGTPVELSIVLSTQSLFLQPLEVRSVRASDKAPFARTELSKAEIEKNNLGQDIPFLLNQTPSVIVNSDAGNGIGYTGIRIRGSDATRINVTLNGIPYNDFESLGTFFVDLPDFASSVSSIQVQRGVGTSSNGAGAFGASINLATNEYRDKAYAELNNSYGSFATWKNTLKLGTGLLGKHFTLDGRLSRINSDGYIERATSNLKSFYISGAYINNRSSLRFNVFSGKEKTYQAWYGVPENMLSSNRRYNPAGTEKPGTPYANQTDNYTQTHYQLFFNHSFSTAWSFNTAVFLTRGKGYYEEYKAGQAFASYGLPDVISGGSTITTTDLVRRRWLDNYFYGQIASLQYKGNRDEWVLGGGWTTYDGKHYGTLPWIQTGTVPPGYRYYDYPALKRDLNLYTKWQHEIARNWYSFMDVQYRHVNHRMDGFEGNAALAVNRSFDFLNPKAGISYTGSNGLQAYFSYALGHKEPNRDDFQASPVSQPNAETLHDFELGLEKKTGNITYGANLYYMYYVNQLVLTGQINDVGAYPRINIPRSHRLGIELQGAVRAASWMRAGANLSLSSNKISSFTEYLDNWDTGGQNAVPHRNTDISFSPSVISGATLDFYPVKDLTVSLLEKYAGKQYLDNTQNEARKLNGFFTQDIRLSYRAGRFLFRQWEFTFQVNNLFNARYEPNGYTYNYIYNNTLTTENGYYPMAGRNFWVGVNVGL